MNLAKKIFLGIWEYLETLIIIVAVVLVVRTYLIQPFLVSGASMEPNFSDGNYLIINELSYRLHDPSRGDVIVFRAPTNDRTFFIKRIIGLPEEEVVVKNGKVEINGFVLEESYLPNDLFTRSDLRVVLGEEEYFVMGDNRSESYDSRSWGPLSRDKIIGVARIRLWPIGQVMAIEAPVY